ncbi:hypothetical protein BH09BAC6_BH09BAC6_31240 [soil metagenome]|jgi:hypothetical protein
MKHLIITLQFICLTAFAGQAQQSAGAASLLNTYYDLKNALVNSDAHAAKEKAALFVQSAAGMAETSLPAGKVDAVRAIRAKLVADAKKISGTADLAAQRGYFAALSLDMYTLAKTISLSAQPIYKAYCPMKQAYWLSNAPAINNPYYGKAMLTCGSVTDTIHPSK